LDNFNEFGADNTNNYSCNSNISAAGKNFPKNGSQKSTEILPESAQNLRKNAPFLL